MPEVQTVGTGCRTPKEMLSHLEVDGKWSMILATYVLRIGLSCGDKQLGGSVNKASASQNGGTSYKFW